MFVALLLSGYTSDAESKYGYGIFDLSKISSGTLIEKKVPEEVLNEPVRRISKSGLELFERDEFGSSINLVNRLKKSFII